jgi:hypothetical protein
MKAGQLFGFIAGGVVVAAGFAAAVYFVDVDQTQETALPDVDLTVENGQLPAFDVETGSVEIGTSEQTIEVPEVEIRTTERSIDVPTLDVQPAPVD